MGIIEKQATRNVIFSYLGAGLGFLTVMWIAHLLSPAENGARGLLISYAALFAQFSNLGFVSVTNRFFPYFRDKEKGHNGFLFYAILISIIGFILCCGVYFFLQPHLIADSSEKSPLFVTYLFYLLPLTFFTIFFNVFDAYLRASFSSVIGSFSKDFLQRILILILLAAYYFKWVDFSEFIFIYIAVTCIPTLILLGYIIYSGEWNVKPVKGFLSKELKTDMVKLGTYAMVTGGAGAIILNIDTIMVNSMLGEEKTGIYGIAIQIGAIMLIPARSLYRIMTSVVAEAFKNDNIKEVSSLYTKSCNNQMAIGLLLFVGIVANILNVIRMIPPEYASGRYVIIVLCVGYLVELATGINQVIIANSKYYRYDTFFTLLMVIVMIVANLIFIPLYGIIGSALATTVTLAGNNFIRFLFLKVKFGMQPYDKNSLKLLLIAVIAIVPSFFIPTLTNKYIDIAIRSSLVGGLYLILMLKLEAAPELNNKIRKNLKRFNIHFL